jgi:hypothetical protein
VKLQGDVRTLAHELIRNRCHADHHDVVHAAYDRVTDPARRSDNEQEYIEVVRRLNDHQAESPKIVRDTRFALNAVDGDILSLELLAGEINHQLKTALDELRVACRLFLPTSKGGRVPDRHQYKDFDVEGVVTQIEKSIKAAWKQHSDLLE